MRCSTSASGWDETYPGSTAGDDDTCPATTSAALHLTTPLDQRRGQRYSRSALAPSFETSPSIIPIHGPPVILAALTYPTIFNFDDHPITMDDVPDGLSNTAMIVEADDDQAVTWTEPKDWTYDPANPRRGLGKMRGGQFMALMADGSVRMISAKTDDATLRAVFVRNDSAR